MHALPMNESSSMFNVTMTSQFSNMTSQFSNTTSYFDNMTSLYDNMTEEMPEESATGASIVSPIVMFLAGLIGNVLALVVLHKTKTEIRSMMFYTLVAALTWNDLVGICLTSPPVLASYINQRQMPAADKLCRFHAFAMVCFGLSTPLIMCAMAIERSLALKCTYFYSKYCNPNSARVLVGILWAFVLLFGALPLFGLGAFKLQYPQTWCFLDFRPTLPLDMAYAYTYAIINLLVVALMILCNGLVMTTLCHVRRTRRMSSASVNSTLLNVDAVDEKASRPPQHMRRRHQRDVELQMICLLCAITTIFSVCWAPLMVYIIYTVQAPHSHSPVFGLVAVRLASLNQTLNPWIYVILRKSLLSRMRRLFRDCIRCSDDSDPPVSHRKLTQYPRIYMPPGKVKGRPHNYVHVRHQLCPSSQFVGKQIEDELLKELHRKRLLKGSSVTRGESEGDGSRSYGRFCTETEEEWRRRGSSGMCSECRARMMLESQSHEDYSVKAPPALHASCRRESTALESTACSHVPEIRSSDETNAALLLPTDGIYVDLFRHLPSSEVPAGGEDCHSHTIISKEPCRPQPGRAEGSATNANSYVSEADDHGYSSRVSTDSSRMSTPERVPSDGRMDEANTHLSGVNDTDIRLTADHMSSCPAVCGEDIALGAKHAPCLQHAGRQDSADVTSGVFDDLLDDAFDDEMDTGKIRGDMEVLVEQRDKRASSSRTLSCSSAGTYVDSSSGREAGRAYRRQLSSSSGH